MKFLATTLFAGFATAEWGVWMPNMSCNPDGQPLLKDNQSTAGDATPEALQMVCQEWCATSSNEFTSQYGSGDPLCCGSEVWDDGETNCYLYMGKQGLDYVASGGEIVSMMDFTYGS